MTKEQFELYRKIENKIEDIKKFLFWCGKRYHGKRLYDRNLTDEQLEKIKYDYDFSKVNLREFSKKQLIRIIYDLKRQVDMYKAGVSDDTKRD